MASYTGNPVKDVGMVIDERQPLISSDLRMDEKKVFEKIRKQIR